MSTTTSAAASLAPLTAPDESEWRTYDEFAAGIDTYRLPNVGLAGTALRLTLQDGTTLSLDFDGETVRWSAAGAIETSGTLVDPYDAVRVRDDVVFVNLPIESREREAITIV